MVAFFDSEAQVIQKVGDEPVLLRGWVPPDNDLAICSVPTCMTAEQGFAVEKMINTQLIAPTVVLTNNIQLARLKQISDAEANQIMEAGNGRAEVLQYEKEEKGSEAGSGGEESSEEGEELRAENSEGAEGAVGRSETSAEVIPFGEDSSERAEGSDQTEPGEEGTSTGGGEGS